MPASSQRPFSYASWDASVSLSAPWLEATDFGEVCRLVPGETLYAEGVAHPYFYLLRSGVVHSTIQRDNGFDFILEIFGPGAIFGEGPAFADQPRPTTVRTVTPAIVSRYLPLEATQEFKRNAELANSIIKLLGFKNRMVVSKLSNLANTRPIPRIIELLARLARLSSSQSNNQCGPCAVNLTHEQIASMTALTRVTVTRALKSLSHQGLIETRPRQIIIRDAVRLQLLLESS